MIPRSAPGQASPRLFLSKAGEYTFTSLEPRRTGSPAHAPTLDGVDALAPPESKDLTSPPAPILRRKRMRDSLDAPRAGESAKRPRATVTPSLSNIARIKTLADIAFVKRTVDGEHFDSVRDALAAKDDDYRAWARMEYSRFSDKRRSRLLRLPFDVGERQADLELKLALLNDGDVTARLLNVSRRSSEPQVVGWAEFLLARHGHGDVEAHLRRAVELLDEPQTLVSARLALAEHTGKDVVAALNDVRSVFNDSEVRLWADGELARRHDPNTLARLRYEAGLSSTQPRRAAEAELMLALSGDGDVVERLKRAAIFSPDSELRDRVQYELAVRGEGASNSRNAANVRARSDGRVFALSTYLMNRRESNVMSALRHMLDVAEDPDLQAFAEIELAVRGDGDTIARLRRAATLVSSNRTPLEANINLALLDDAYVGIGKLRERRLPSPISVHGRAELELAKRGAGDVMSLLKRALVLAKTPDVLAEVELNLAIQGDGDVDRRLIAAYQGSSDGDVKGRAAYEIALRSADQRSERLEEALELAQAPRLRKLVSDALDQVKRSTPSPETDETETSSVAAPHTPEPVPSPAPRGRSETAPDRETDKANAYDPELDAVFPIRHPLDPKIVHPMFAKEKEPQLCRVKAQNLLNDADTVALPRYTLALLDEHVHADTDRAATVHARNKKWEERTLSLHREVRGELTSIIDHRRSGFAERVAVRQLDADNCAGMPVLHGQLGVFLKDYQNQPLFKDGHILGLYAGSRLANKAEVAAYDEDARYGKDPREEYGVNIDGEEYVPYGGGNFCQYFNTACNTAGKVLPEATHAVLIPLNLKLNGAVDPSKSVGSKKARKRIKHKQVRIAAIALLKPVPEGEQILLDYGEKYLVGD